jgi:acyl carrier protein
LSDNETKLREAFALGLNLAQADVSDDLKYSISAGWDSIAHMTLVAVLDETFDINLSADDVIDMSSYCKAREILAKYGVRF